MKLLKYTILSLLFLITSLFVKGQAISLGDTTISDAKVLLRKENSGFLMIHTAGFGAGYRAGKHITGYKKRMFEVELTGMKHPKEVRIVSPYDNARSYIYGKENFLFILRGGIGKQKVINSKPYWGGVELRYFYSGGVSMGFLKPVYLYIIHGSGDHYFYLLEKYDPYKHFWDNIYGRAPFFQGFNKIKPLPGIYFKTGFNFEYGAYDETLKAIECGLAIDAYKDPAPIMAFNKNKSIFLSLYFSFHFGTRRN
ncbi:MAG TPA: hypothetical protein PKK00_00235 [Bacteroidales bacterium]|nr:hypothetical protein [Bacteroidales bacterium]HPS16255.1 hypothetical protein [Bacteroidales bacterium]